MVSYGGTIVDAAPSVALRSRIHITGETACSFGVLMLPSGISRSVGPAVVGIGKGGQLAICGASL
ncbi:MAG: hypothetical protein DRJ50_12305 [Actinobacteria bacterium]|nr:MAG: hypothetical protein DRJ50_12305 [Actinomycetota bacterium]